MLSNPAAIAHAPKRQPLASAASRAWNAQQLRTFLDLTVGHRFHVVLWVAANTGMRRGELLGLRRVQETHASFGTPPHPAARSSAHACDPASKGRRSDQSRLRTARSLNAGVHDGDLPARAARHASRSCEDLRITARPSTGFHPVEVPVEATPHATKPRSVRCLTWASQWRGRDLNPRPSGYEPDELPDCSTPRRSSNVTSEAMDRQPAVLASRTSKYRCR